MSLQVQTKRTKSADDYEDFEEVMEGDGDGEEEEMEQDGDTNPDEFDSDKEDEQTDVRCDREKSGEVTSKHDIITTNSEVLSLTDTSASNKLLQLCSQLVKQEVC